MVGGDVFCLARGHFAKLFGENVQGLLRLCRRRKDNNSDGNINININTNVKQQNTLKKQNHQAEVKRCTTH